MMEASRAFLIAAGIGVAVSAASAQPKFPRADLTPTVVTSPVRPGAGVRLSLKVRLPADIHVQSDKPKDPFLIPTALTVTATAGVTVDRIVYPKPTDLAQAGRSQSLPVFGSEFTIDVRVTLEGGVPAGDLVVPAQFKYQACDAAVCYPPAKAEVKWTLPVEAGAAGAGPWR